MNTHYRDSRKIDPSRDAVLGDGTPNEADRIEIGPTQLAFREWAAAGLELPNLARMREFRWDRLTRHVIERDYAGLLMFDPLNIRYATDTSNMQLWIAHNPCRACFVSADGYVILWDFHSCDHLSSHLPLVREVRHGASFFYFESGDRTAEHARRFAAEVADVVTEHGGDNRRLAVDKIEWAGLDALRRQRLEIFEGQEVTEQLLSDYTPGQWRQIAVKDDKVQGEIEELNRQFDEATAILAGDALQALAERISADPGARLVLNGDFHWFDAEPGAFATLQALAARHVLLAGNVEAELGDPDDERVLASALAAEVDVLVSGDRDFLDNIDLCPVRVLNPRAFWELVRGGAS